MSLYRNYHGMPVSHLMGWIQQDFIKGFEWLKPCLKKEDIVYIGIRDIDDDEHINLKKNNIKCFTPEHIEKFGIGQVLQKAIDYLDPNKENVPIHVSLDIDGVDPSLAPGTGTKSNGGLNYREIHYIMRSLAAYNNFVSMDLTEINEDLEVSQEKRKKYFGDPPLLEGTQTVFLGSEIILSALGRSHIDLNNESI